MREQHAAGEVDGAIEAGGEWLTENADAPPKERAAVKRLVAEYELEQALVADTIPGLQRFRSRYKDDPALEVLVKQAFNREAAVQYEAVTRHQTEVAPFHQFRIRYAGAPIIAVARKKEAGIAFATAKAAGTVDSYAWFRSEYGAWAEAEALARRAHDAEAELALQAAKAAGSVEDIEGWRKRYPEPRFQHRGRKAEIDVALRQVRAAKQLTAYRWFRERYSAWDEAASALRGLRHHELALAMDEALKAATVGAYRNFRQTYQDWPDAAAARMAMYGEEASLALKQAIEAKDRAAIGQVARDYPEPRWRDLADLAEAELVYGPWREALAAKKLPGDSEMQAFIEDVPKLRSLRQLTGSHADLYWSFAIRGNRTRPFALYRALFPESDKFDESRRREADLAWRHAQADDSAAALIRFARDYPEHAHAPTAEARYFRLRKLQDLKTRYPRAHITRRTLVGKDEVELHLDVRDCSNKRVSGLTRGVFEVLEGADNREITHFQGLEQDRPIDIVFVIDLSGSMSTEQEAVRQAVTRFAETFRFRGRDAHLGLVPFADKIVGVQRPRGGSKEFRRWMSELHLLQGGGAEDGAKALVVAAGMPWRRSAERVVVMLTDEDLQIFEEGRRALKDRNVRVGRLNPRSKAMAALGRTLARVKARPFFLVPQQTTGFQDLAVPLQGQVLPVPQNTSNPIPYMRQLDDISDQLSKQYVVRYRLPKGRRRSAAKADLAVLVRPMHVWNPLSDVGAKSVVSLGSLGRDPNCPELVAATRDEGLFRSSKCGTAWAPIPLPGDMKELAATTSLGDRLALVTSTGSLVDVDTQTGGARMVATGLTSVRQVALAASGELWALGTAASSKWALARARKGAASVDVVLPDLAVAEGTSPALFLSSDVRGPLTCVLRSPTESVCLRPPPVAAEGEESPPAPTIVRATQGLPANSLKGPARAYSPMSRPWIVLLASADGSVHRSADGGVRWAAALPAKTGFHNLVEVPGIRPSLCSSATKSVICSEDLGRTWARAGHDFEGGDPGGLAVVGGEVLLGQGGKVSQLFLVTNRELPSSSLYFDTNKSEPKAAMVGFLGQLAQTLRADRSLSLRIEGHADHRGSSELNERLAQERAANIAKHIVAAAVDGTRLHVLSFGERRPIRPGASKGALARNRRVELVLLRSMPRDGWGGNACAARPKRQPRSGPGGRATDSGKEGAP